jgi:hypothetical protein
MIMKLRFGMFMVAIILLITDGCNHEDPQTPQYGQVTFSFKRTDNDLSGGRTQDKYDPAFVSYTLKKPDGSSISAKIEIYQFNESFISHPMQLNTGSYNLEQFLILNTENKVIYAAPTAGSAMAAFVDYPLPLSVIITADKGITVIPEVLAVEGHTPEDFGYAIFGFDIVGHETIPLRVNAALLIGEIIYENVEASIKVKGFDADNNEEWSAGFPFSGPDDNVLAFKKGFHHYTIEMEKWGMIDRQTITAQQLWENRADGPEPVTYRLSGAAPAKKLAYTVSYQTPPGNTLVPDEKLVYHYNTNGKLERLMSYSFSSETSAFEIAGYYLFTWSGQSLAKLSRYNYPDNSLIREDTYQYGGSEVLVKITQEWGSIIEMSLNADEKGKIITTYRHSNGAIDEFEFLTTLKNLVLSKGYRPNEALLCNEGVYTYDRSINPFKHLGYIDFSLTHYSINNRLTEDINYIDCAFPEVWTESYSYEYDDQGYPTVKTTHYRNKKGIPFIAQTRYFYQ